MSDVVARVSRVAAVQGVHRGAVAKDGHAALVDFTIKGDKDKAVDKVQPALDAVAAAQAAHPGFTKTNLQSSGPSHGKDSPTLLARFYGASRQLASFMWQEVDEGIQPALYGAVSPGAQGGTFYGPRGFLEAAGGGVKHARIPGHCRSEADCRRLWEVSEQLTGVSYLD